MKKLLLAMALILTISTSSFAASIFATTIRDCNSQKVQDVLIEVMTGKNFVINEVTPYKVTFDKNFGDGFWTAAQNTTVRFTLLERDGNVKMMVSETEKMSNGWGGWIERKRSIDQLIPLIQEVKNTIDHTPMDQIKNEAVDQLPGSGNVREKKLGLTISDKDSGGFYRVLAVEPGSAAADAKIVINDKILELNGQSVSGMDKSGLDSYIANKWASGASLIILIDHDGTQNMVTLKKQ